MTNNLKTIIIVGTGTVLTVLITVLCLHTIPKLVETVANSEVA